MHYKVLFDGSQEGVGGASGSITIEELEARANNEKLLLSLVNLANYAAKQKIDHWTVIDAVVTLRENGVPEKMLPSIDYMLPESIKNFTCQVLPNFKG